MIRIFWKLIVPLLLLILISTGILGSYITLRLSTADSSINYAINGIIWILISVAVLVIFAAGIISRNIIRQVRQVTKAAERISAGQFDQQIQVGSGDEIGRLGQAFNKMSVNLEEMMTSVSDEKSKLVTVLSTMADGVVVTDPKGNILLANSAAETIFNFRESKVTGKPLIEAIINHEIDSILKKCLSSYTKQVAQIDTTSGRFLRVIAVPLKPSKISGVLLLFQDLTEMRSLQTKRREFIGNASHELRTPLSGIKAIVETLQAGAIEDKEVTQDFLGKINSEVDNMTQMVSELIELSRIETGKVNLDVHPVELNTLLSETMAHLAPQAERKQLGLAAELDNNLPAVQVDRERIHQVITNIIYNAIKFTPPGGKIIISSRVQDNKIVVSISDTGIGISNQDLPHIFERFFKADKSRSSGGSGLGLAIAKHIIQAHGGTIWVQSLEGKGSTFSFSLTQLKI